MVNKRRLKEIDEWEKENIIDAESAEKLRKKYSEGGNRTLTTIFAIFSAVFVGAGVILIFATNWRNLPIEVKGVVSFVPMLVGQAAAVYTVLKKYGNNVFRECVSIAYTAGICASLAMINNSFNVSDFAENYVLACVILTLPVMYILSAVSPLILYFAGAIYCGASGMASAMSLKFAAFVLLIALGALLILRIKSEETPVYGRIEYVRWLNIAAVLAFIIVTADKFNFSDGTATELAYFAVIFSLSDRKKRYLDACGIFGTLGIAVIIGVFSSFYSWYAPETYYSFGILLAQAVPAVILCVAAVIMSVIKGLDKFKISIIIPAFFCVLLLILFSINLLPSQLLCTVLSNAAMLATGISLIVFGTNDCNAFQTNVGILTVGAMVVLRFFNWNFNIFAKGIVFIAIGVAFFLVNRHLAKRKKNSGDSEEVRTQ